MHNSFLASFLTCHNLQQETTYFSSPDSRNSPGLSGSNSTPEEKQPCQGLAVCMYVWNIKAPIYCTAAELWKSGTKPIFCTHRELSGMINTQLPVERATSRIDSCVSTRLCLGRRILFICCTYIKFCKTCKILSYSMRAG